jgi:hypothetical protein
MHGLLIALALVGCGKPPESLASKTRFKLTYAWPIGDRTVDVTLRRTRAQGGDRDTRDVAASYALHVGPGGVITADAVHTRLPEVGDADLLEQLAIGAWPAFSVDAHGGFVGLVDPAAVDTSVQATFAAAPEAARAALARALSVSEITTGAQNDWTMLVSRWNGRTFELGQAVESRGEDAVDALGHMAVTTVIHDTLLGVVPCRGDGPPVCVRLRHESVLSPESTVAVSEAIRAAVDAGFAGAGVAKTSEVRSLDYLDATELVVDPSTLVPYEVTLERHVGAEVAVGDEVVAILQVDTVKRSYSP